MTSELALGSMCSPGFWVERIRVSIYVWRVVLFSLALCVAPCFESSAAATKTQLLDRIAELRQLHDDLFRRTEAELLLPYRLPPYERERWTVVHLVEAIDIAQWTAEEQEAVTELLDAAVLERRAGYFRLDEEARLTLKYRPRALLDAIRSRNILELWANDPSSTRGWSDAKAYLNARTKLVSAGLNRLPIAERASAWLAELDGFSFLTGSAQVGYDKLLALEFAAARTRTPLAADQQRELDDMRQIQKTWKSRTMPGPELAAMADLGHQGIAKLLAARKAKAPSERSMRTMAGDLNRLARTLAALQGPAERKQLGSLRIEIRSPSDTTAERSPWHDSSLRFFSLRDENDVGLVEAEPAAVFAGFATCAFQSQVAKNWDFRRMLNPDLPTVETLWEQRRGGREIEPDFQNNRIFRLPVNWDGDNLTPSYPLPEEDAIDATRRMLGGFDLCIGRYFAFVISHELAHLYLPPTGRAKVSTDEIAADCQALRTIERLRRLETESGRSSPDFQSAEGFMRHLFEGSKELSQALSREGFDAAKFQRRYELLEQAKSCAAQ